VFVFGIELSGAEVSLLVDRLTTGPLVAWATAMPPGAAAVRISAAAPARQARTTKPLS
jgi:hypothetical protein